MRRSLVLAVAFVAGSCVVAAPAAHAETVIPVTPAPFPPFPYTVADPFSHGVETVQQLDDAGNWIDVDAICAGEPIRLTAPETPEGLATGFNYRLAVDDGLSMRNAIPTTSASAESSNAAALGWVAGHSYQFAYYADAGRGWVVRFNSWSGGVPWTVPYFPVVVC